MVPSGVHWYEGTEDARALEQLARTSFMVSVADPDWWPQPRTLDDVDNVYGGDGTIRRYAVATDSRLELVVRREDAAWIFGVVLIRGDSGLVECTFAGAAELDWRPALRTCESMRELPADPAVATDEPLDITVSLDGEPWVVTVPRGVARIDDGRAPTRPEWWTQTVETPSFRVELRGLRGDIPQPAPVITEGHALWDRDDGLTAEHVEQFGSGGALIQGSVIVRSGAGAVCYFTISSLDDWEAPLAACRTLRKE